MRAYEFLTEGEDLIEGPINRWAPKRNSKGGLVKGALAAGAAAAMGVGAMNMMHKEPVQQTAPQVNPEDLKMLALTMWGEARNQGEEGMRAVGHVIKNRADENKPNLFGAGIKGVATASHQFSAWNKGDPNRQKMNNIDKLDPSSEDYSTWQKAQRLAANILTGRDPDPTKGSLYYHTTAVNPRWARNIDPVVKIGSHLFYNDNPT